MRIVPDALWDAARARKTQSAEQPAHGLHRPKHLFSGLVFCGCRGAAFTIKSKDQLACAAHREKGTCDNGRTIHMAELERRVLAAIRDDLLGPEAGQTFLAGYNAERKRLRQDSDRRRSDLAACSPS